MEQVRYIVRWIDAENGESKEKTFSTKEEANAFALGLNLAKGIQIETIKTKDK